MQSVKLGGKMIGHKKTITLPSNTKKKGGRLSRRPRGIVKFREDRIAIVETNVDDVTGEILGSAIERLFRAGALDVTVSSYLGKKGRMGQTIRVVCLPQDTRKFAELLVKETGSLGVKTTEYKRLIVPRREIAIPFSFGSFKGRVTAKVARTSDGILRVKPELAEVHKIAERENASLQYLLELFSAKALEYLKGVAEFGA